MPKVRVLCVVGVIFLVGISFALDTSLRGNEALGRCPQLNILATPPPLVGQIPAPDGAPRGLTFDGEYLWCANSGDGNSQFGSKIYKLDPTNGDVIASFDSPGGDGADGFAWDGQYLWHSNHLTGMIYKLNPANGQVVSSFLAPGAFPFDLAWDGEYLYQVNGNTDQIFKVDVSTGSAIDTIFCTYPSGNVRPFGLVYLPFELGQVWTSDGDYGSNLVNEWDIQTSSWIDQWASDPADYPCGLAYDPGEGYLYLSCWTDDLIYIFDVGVPTAVSERSPTSGSLKLSLLPNVTSGKVTAAYHLSHPGKISLNLYDSSGRLVRVLKTGNTEAGSYRANLDLSGIPSGVFFLSLRAGELSTVERLILMR